jgi:flagellar export protein FliJ
MPPKAKKSKRFKYNLQTLLKVREIRKKQAEDAYNEAQRQLEIERQKEEEIRKKEILAYANFREYMKTGDLGDTGEINRHKTHVEKVKLELIRQIEAVRLAVEKVEEARLELVKCLKDEKIMEKDKEHKREAWRKLMDKEAGKFLDDISTVSFVKKTSQ